MLMIADIPDFIIYTALILFGLTLGSFLNVVIYRIPQNQSIVTPASRCPFCQTPLKAYDNIPVLSFILLRGKCRYCRAAISVRYPIVELLTALLLLALVLRFGLNFKIIPLMTFVSALVALSFIDIDVQLLPDRLNFSLIGFGLFGAFINDLILAYDFWHISFLDALKGLLVGFFVLIIIYYGFLKLTGKEGMGGGDMKMLAMIGVFLGWEKTLLTLFLGCFFGSLVSIPLLLFLGRDRSTKISFGPFLALGALFSLFYGDMLIYLYSYHLRNAPAAL
ncbi:prepilin peptidase [candidate division CSSED10-310 bacterium]|uniref:Prepilin leader peptidase/N-methyltransferase n=1 Tax=candidate division CSSED10-310 bacterium TaxID=2855610 RepID=A0ABV6YS24_UNCC1